MKEIVARKVAERNGQQPPEPRVPRNTEPGPTEGSLKPLTEPPSPARYPHTIGLRISVKLYATIVNALDGAHSAGDYTFTSLPDVVRAALAAYFDGMTLTTSPIRGPKKRTTIGLSDELKALYDQLPSRKRGEIVERALRTFLSRGMVFSAQTCNTGEFQTER